jgi:hypothetical protein
VLLHTPIPTRAWFPRLCNTELSRMSANSVERVVVQRRWNHESEPDGGSTGADRHKFK